MNSIVCTGKSSSTTTTEALDIGEVAIDLTSASGYTVGKYVFITESDDTELECLGDIVGVDGNTITVRHGPAAAKSTAAIVWTPTSIVDFGIGYSGYNDPKTLGTRVDLSVGGSFHKNKIAATSQQITFLLPAITTAIYDTWNTFIETTLSGYDSFTFVNEKREIYQVHDLTNVENKQHISKYWISLQIALGVIAEDTYD